MLRAPERTARVLEEIHQDTHSDTGAIQKSNAQDLWWRSVKSIEGYFVVGQVLQALEGLGNHTRGIHVQLQVPRMHREHAVL